MIAKQRVGSVFGKPTKQTYILADEINDKSSVLIPDGFVGINALPFTSKNLKVTLYEPDTTFLQGGSITIDGKTKNVKGLQKRIDAYEINKLLKYENQNFYESTSSKKYDFVYVNNSLERDCNMHLTLSKKIKKLQKAIKPDGHLYIIYKLTNSTYLETNQYFRQYEILSYFPKSDWEIISSKESMDKLIGHIHIRKKTSQEKKERYYSFNIKTADYFMST